MNAATHWYRVFQYGLIIRKIAASSVMWELRITNSLLPSIE